MERWTSRTASTCLGEGELINGKMFLHSTEGDGRGGMIPISESRFLGLAQFGSVSRSLRVTTAPLSLPSAGSSAERHKTAEATLIDESPHDDCGSGQVCAP